MKKLQFLLLIFSMFIFEIQAQNYSQPSGAGSSGTDNTSLGTLAGSNGTNNTAVGKQAGDVVTGSNNSFLGKDAGKAVSSSSNNSFFGASAGLLNTTGADNTFLGYQAGRSNVSGARNIFIGKDAGYFETGSDKLYIDNSNTSAPLIFGNFSSNQVGINSLPNTTHALTIGGSIYSSSSLHSTALYTNTLYVNGSLMKAWSTDAANINYTGGAVGIGTIAIPNDFKLAVAGKVIAEELVIKLEGNWWPDYVFEKNYQLPSLEELQLFIAAHKHLPGVPSAKEIENNGVSVGEMNVILLKKIEELTLYVIKQQAEIEALKRKVN